MAESTSFPPPPTKLVVFYHGIIWFLTITSGFKKNPISCTNSQRFGAA